MIAEGSTSHARSISGASLPLALPIALQRDDQESTTQPIAVKPVGLVTG